MPNKANGWLWLFLWPMTSPVDGSSDQDRDRQWKAETGNFQPGQIRSICDSGLRHCSCISHPFISSEQYLLICNYRYIVRHDLKWITFLWKPRCSYANSKLLQTNSLTGVTSRATSEAEKHIYPVPRNIEDMISSNTVLLLTLKL